ncbi:hypothetical protein JB92DRAFT_2980773, partial [Gautieria morchelliformis]
MRIDLLGQLTDYLIHMLHTSLNLDQVLFLALHGSCKFFMGSLKSFYLLLYRRQRNRLEDVTIRLHCGNRGLRFGQRIGNSTQRPLRTRTRMPSFLALMFCFRSICILLLHTVAS